MGFMHLSILINRLGNSYRPFGSFSFLCGPFLSFHIPLCGQLVPSGVTPNLKPWALGSPKLVLKFYVKIQLLFPTFPMLSAFCTHAQISNCKLQQNKHGFYLSLDFCVLSLAQILLVCLSMYYLYLYFKLYLLYMLTLSLKTKSRNLQRVL